MTGLVRDEHFNKVFRLDEESNQMDKLSLLACNRQGIMVDELLHRPEEMFDEPGLAPEKRLMRFQTYEKRRLAKMNLVEEERHALVFELSHKFTKYKSTAEASSPTTQTASVASHDSFDMTDYSQKLQEKHAADIRRLKAREMKLVEMQMQFEVSREELDDRIKKREQQRLEHEQEKQHQRAVEADKRQRETQEKLEKLRLINAIQEEQKRDKTLKKDEVRKGREQRKREETTIYQQAKGEELANKLYTVTERHKLVQDALTQRAEMQLKDMAHKQQLHFERRKFLTLHRDTLKEVNKIKALQKQIAIHESCAQRQSEEELWKESLLDKYAAAQERVVRQKEEKRIDTHERRLMTEAHERKRRERVCLNELKTSAVQESLMYQHEAKDEVIQTRKVKLNGAQQIKAEQKRIRMQNWIDNKARIDRVNGYKQMVVLSKIEQEKLKIQQIEAEKKKMRDEHARQRQMTALQKEKLLAEISHLRTSAEPHAFLAKSRELSKQVAQHKEIGPTKRPNRMRITRHTVSGMADSPSIRDSTVAAPNGQPVNTSTEPEGESWDVEIPSSRLQESESEQNRASSEDEADHQTGNTTAAADLSSNQLDASTISASSSKAQQQQQQQPQQQQQAAAATVGSPQQSRAATSLGFHNNTNKFNLSSTSSNTNDSTTMKRPNSTSQNSISGLLNREKLRNSINIAMPQGQIRSSVKDAAAHQSDMQLPGQMDNNGAILGQNGDGRAAGSLLYLTPQPRYQRTGRNMLIANELVIRKTAVQ